MQVSISLQREGALSLIYHPRHEIAHECKQIVRGVILPASVSDPAFSSGFIPLTPAPKASLTKLNPIFRHVIRAFPLGISPNSRTLCYGVNSISGCATLTTHSWLSARGRTFINR